MSDASIRVMQLLDELEDILTTSSKVPFSEKTIVDGEEIASIIEDIRLSLPKDIQQAKWVKDEQERILNEAKNEYDKVIVAAKAQAEYLVETDVIKKEAEKRAQALLSEAENHSRYVKLRSYEYVDKLLYDMQNDIANVAGDYIQPMNDYFTDMLSSINERVNGNRQEMRSMAERIQNTGSEDVVEHTDVHPENSHNENSYEEDSDKTVQ